MAIAAEIEDPTGGQAAGMLGPYEDGFTITPGVPFPVLVRGIYVGTAGHVTIETRRGGILQFKNLPVGFHRIRARRVIAGAGTTAADLVGVY